MSAKRLGYALLITGFGSSIVGALIGSAELQLFGLIVFVIGSLMLYSQQTHWML